MADSDGTADRDGVDGGEPADSGEPDRRSIWARLEEQDREEAARSKGFRLAFFTWLGLNSLYVIGRPAIDNPGVELALQVALILAGLAIVILGVTSTRRRRRR